MSIKQLSVFVENKPGRLAEVTTVLHRNNIDIRALSLADTTDFGILRLIVNEPDKAYEVLKEAGLTVSLTNVMAIGVKDQPGGLSVALNALNEEGVSVEYMYAFIGRKENTAFVILRADNSEKAVDVITKAGIDVLSSKEIFELM